MNTWIPTNFIPIQQASQELRLALFYSMKSICNIMKYAIYTMK